MQLIELRFVAFIVSAVGGLGKVNLLKGLRVCSNQWPNNNLKKK